MKKHWGSETGTTRPKAKFIYSVIRKLSHHFCMALDEVTTGLLRELMERVSTEHDPEKLQELVLAVNRLLDAIETQISKLEGPNDPSVH